MQHGDLGEREYDSYAPIVAAGFLAEPHSGYAMLRNGVRLDGKETE